MPKITEEELELIQVRFFKSDLNYVRKIFGHNIGVNKAIRHVLRSHVNQWKASAATAIDIAESAKSEESQ